MNENKTAKKGATNPTEHNSSNILYVMDYKFIQFQTENLQTTFQSAFDISL